MIHFFCKTFWYRALGIVLFLSAIFYGVRMVDLIIDDFVIHGGMVNKGATKITTSHFRQPEESILDKHNFDLFLENVTRHKEGILAWKPLYVFLLGIYLVLACLAVMKLVYTEKVELREIGT